TAHSPRHADRARGYADAPRTPRQVASGRRYTVRPRRRALADWMKTVARLSRTRQRRCDRTRSHTCPRAYPSNVPRIDRRCLSPAAPRLTECVGISLITLVLAPSPIASQVAEKGSLHDSNRDLLAEAEDISPETDRLCV